MGEHVFTETAQIADTIPPFKLIKQVKTTSGVSKFVDMDNDVLFTGKRVIIFGLPGAFTPTCSSKQLPGFETQYHLFRNLGIDDIYCISVNDTFVMNEWAQDQGLVNVKLIPDGSAQLTIKLGMDVRKDNLQFGVRSWRYAAIYDDGKLVQSFIEEGFGDNFEEDPYVVSTPENVMEWIRNNPFEGKDIKLDISDSTDIKENIS